MQIDIRLSAQICTQAMPKLQTHIAWASFTQQLLFNACSSYKKRLPHAQFTVAVAITNQNKKKKLKKKRTQASAYKDEDNKKVCKWQTALQFNRNWWMAKQLQSAIENGIPIHLLISLRVYVLYQIYIYMLIITAIIAILLLLLKLRWIKIIAVCQEKDSNRIEETHINSIGYDVWFFLFVVAFLAPV